MRFLPIVAMAISVTALGACANSSQKATVASAESGLTVAGHAVLAYDSLPLCPTGAPLCHTDAVKAQVRVAFDKAYGVVTDAQTAVDAGKPADITAVNTAMSALQAIIALFPKQQ